MIDVVFKNSKYICNCSYSEKDIPKAAGFWWSREEKCWWTGDMAIAKKLSNYATQSVLEQFKATEEAVVMSHAANSIIDIPVPEGLEYLPFQKAGIQYINGKSAALIGDDMGLGKTIQAVGLININESIKSVVILCPAILKLNWRNELQTWLVRNYKISIGYGTQLKTADFYSKGDEKDVYGTILILNYDILKSNIEHLKKQKFDLFIADEAHYLKSWKAGRTKAANQLTKISKVKLFLTGTPVTKYPLDLFPILQMSNHYLAKWKYFTEYFCNAKEDNWGHMQFSSSNEDELQKHLRSGFMVRRMKSAVLTELPPKTRQVIVLPADTVKGVVDAEKAYLSVMKETARKIREANNFTDAIEKMRDSKRANLLQLVKLRKETALAKIPIAIQHIEHVLESQEKVVIFAHHKEVIHAVYEHFKKVAVLITGDTEAGARQQNINAFQTNIKVRVFCATIMSCGTGVTLTAAQTAVFLEQDWLPSNMEQAEDRLYRIGQAGNVLIQYLVIDGSIDAKIAKSLIRKKKVIDKVTNKK